MKNRRLTLVVLVALAGVGAMCLPASSSAGTYNAFVGCGPGHVRPEHSCSLASAPTAFFQSTKADGVHYKFCLRKPSGKSRCRLAQAGPRGIYDKRSLAS